MVKETITITKDHPHYDIIVKIVREMQERQQAFKKAVSEGRVMEYIKESKAIR